MIKMLILLFLLQSCIQMPKFVSVRFGAFVPWTTNMTTMYYYWNSTHGETVPADAGVHVETRNTTSNDAPIVVQTMPSRGNMMKNETNSTATITAMISKDEIMDQMAKEAKTLSLKILFQFLQGHLPNDGSIENDVEPESKEEKLRCERYGLEFNATVLQKRRRIFWGSTIADDSWHSIGVHAAEAHGLYHTVALIESNTTFMLTERKLRFAPGSQNLLALQSGIFGPKTNVVVENYVADMSINPNAIWIEHLQRELILKIWKENGMTVNDIGIVSDIDEVFTRDFLLAAQTCDVPMFRPGQNCRTPKIVASTLIFESSPECITQHRRWFHPDMIIGECIDTIGDRTIHLPLKREYANGTLGLRLHGHGKLLQDYDNMTNITMYPLWKPVDFRSAEGSDTSIREYVLESNRKRRYSGHIAFHFHNAFDDFQELRHKYKTYGHPISKAFQMPLGELQEDIDMAVKCVMNRTTTEAAASKKMEYVRGGFNNVLGRKPILYENSPEYRSARNSEFKEMVIADEKKYGTYNK